MTTEEAKECRRIQVENRKLAKSQESAPAKKAKDRKADRHRVPGADRHKNHMLKCRICNKVLQRERSFVQHLKTFHFFNDADKIKEELDISRQVRDEQYQQKDFCDFIQGVISDCQKSKIVLYKFTTQRSLTYEQISQLVANPGDIIDDLVYRNLIKLEGKKYVLNQIVGQGKLKDALDKSI